MNIQTLPMETERLLLRPFQLEDTMDVLQNWASDPQVQHMYREPVYTTPDAVMQMLERYLHQCDTKSACRWAICPRETGRCIGQISYYLIDTKNHWAELEYCMGRAFQKKGFMTEAVRAAIKYGFETMQLHKVQISHITTNSASRRVIEKCGFHYDGTLRDAIYTAPDYVDRLFYSILESEYTNKF